VRIYYQGDTSSRWEIPANSEIFKNIFVPYDGAVQDVDLGAHSLSATGATLSGLTASRLLSSDGSKALASTDLASWVTGTSNRVTVTDDGDGTITLSGPQDIHTGATPTFAGLTLTGNITMPDGGTIGQAAGPLIEFDDTNNRLEIMGCRVGIGTATPGSLLHIYGTNPTLRIDADTAGGTSALNLREAGVAKWFIANRGAYGDRLYIAGDGGIVADAFVIIEQTSRVGIGIETPSAQLHIDQSSITAAIPVLALDQADVSEEFIRFIGEAAAATLTQSIVAEADVTTATRQGFLKVYIQDDGDQVADGPYFVPFYSLS